MTDPLPDRWGQQINLVGSMLDYLTESLYGKRADLYWAALESLSEEDAKHIITEMMHNYRKGATGGVVQS